MLNLNVLAKMVAEKEGLKKSLSIAQIKEVLGCLCDEIWWDPQIIEALIASGRRRAKKRTLKGK
jgi:hypothetical protein